MLKVLVVGGAGYLGSVLVGKLLEKGHKVRVLDTLFYGMGSLQAFTASPDFEFLKGDIRNVADIIKSLDDRSVDAVVHLAAIVGEQACEINPEVTKEINIKATRDVAQVCAYFKVPRMIFTSTCSVYGEGGSDWIKEDCKAAPIELYASSKLTCEKELLGMRSKTFHPTIFRLATLYGLSPRMRFDLVVNTFVARAIADGEIQVFGGEQWRPLMHVSDCADAIIRCLGAPVEKVSGEVFNVGSNSHNFKIIDIAKMIKENFPELKITVRKDVQDKRNYRVNFDKIKGALGFDLHTNIQNAITEIHSFITENDVDYTSPRYSNFKSISTDPKVQEKVYTSGPI